jgi:hypothetical protein
LEGGCGKRVERGIEKVGGGEISGRQQTEFFVRNILPQYRRGTQTDSYNVSTVRRTFTY